MVDFGEGIFRENQIPPQLLEYQAEQAKQNRLKPTNSASVAPSVSEIERPVRERIFSPDSKISNLKLIDVDHPQFPTGNWKNCGIGSVDYYLITNPFDPRLKLNAQRILDAQVAHLVGLWIADYLPVSSDRAILFQQQNPKHNKWGLCRKEFDVLTLYKGEPDVVFEVKNTTSKDGHRNGMRQARDLAKALSTKWPEVRGCLVTVDVDPFTQDRILIGENMAFNVSELQSRLRDPKTGSKIMCFRLSLEDLNTFGRQMGKALELNPAYPGYSC